ncbi:hypothetical protein Tco_0982438, partial [Tanacetum coccineum]
PSKLCAPTQSADDMPFHIVTVLLGRVTEVEALLRSYGNLPLIHLEFEVLELNRRELDKQEVEQPEVDRLDLDEPGIGKLELD